MKKFLAISVISLMLVGGGCGAASTGGSAQGSSAVSSAFETAQLKFSAKDKTAAAQTALGADGEQLASFTEYKFEGGNLIVLVGEAKDAANSRRLGSKLEDTVKAQAAAAGLRYSSVGGLNDPKWFAFSLAGVDDSQLMIKALSAISK